MKWKVQRSEKHACSTYDGELDVCVTEFGSILIDILYPGVVVLKTVGRNANELDATFFEVGGTTSDLTQLSGTNRSEVSRMREENCL
jgi:hypothetical protein